MDKNNSSIKCVDVFNQLRIVLDEYSTKLSSVDIEIFAIEMGFDPSGSESRDPALSHAFFDECGDLENRISRESAFEVAASFVEKELVLHRQVEKAREIVEDLRSIRAGSREVPAFLVDWLHQ